MSRRKRIGIIGGLSPESTIEYYKYIVHTYTQRFGDHNYPEILIFSVSFEPFIGWPRDNKWDLIARELGKAAKSLEAGGADFIVIATNTMHVVQKEIQAAVAIPLLSILDVVGDAIIKEGINAVGLIGTRFTMDATLYPDALSERGIKVIRPEEDDREYVNKVIYNELIAGKFTDESKNGFLRVIDRLQERGAKGIILGCTEIPILLEGEDTSIPLFDTTKLHAEAALESALNGKYVKTRR